MVSLSATQLSWDTAPRTWRLCDLRPVHASSGRRRGESLCPDILAQLALRSRLRARDLQTPLASRYSDFKPHPSRRLLLARAVGSCDRRRRGGAARTIGRPPDISSA
eukprot:3195475-Pyramimonas_sp.AAC.1